MDTRVEAGRDAAGRGAWDDAYRSLASADDDGLLSPDDVELLALCAYLSGRDAASRELYTRAVQAWIDAGDVERAAACAFWIGMHHVDAGDMAQASGWFQRGQRILGDRDCPTRGYYVLPGALVALNSGDVDAALAAFEQAAEIGERAGDIDLSTLGRLGIGQAAVSQARLDEGLAHLDEAMVAVTAGEVSPMVAGIVYCAVIETCQAVFDLRRAAEWTEALGEWCASQPDLVPFRGQCMVHRVEILRTHGRWEDAADEIVRARELLVGPPDRPAAGAAFYQDAELCRLRGDTAAAEAAYGEANLRGHTPQPGLALLRLAQGDGEAALASIRRAVDEAAGPTQLAHLLGAYVEITLATGDVEAAAEGNRRLAAIDDELGTSFLHATALHAAGSVALASGDAADASRALREAAAVWQELDAPYERARSWELLAAACRRLGDADGAALALQGARRTFEDLGAGPDLARIGEPADPTTASTAPLTARELEVLRLAAAGATNREIATQLTLSEHTVRRHLQNTFAKLGVSSRAAATSYAYEHGLIRG